MKYIPRRRSIRFKGYDYAQTGLYFITLCCQYRMHLFGQVQCGEMRLNQFGKKVEEEWLKTAEIRDHIGLHEYIIMPNHFHAIIEIITSRHAINEDRTEFKSPSQTIGAVIRGFKGATTKRIKEIIYKENVRANCNSPQPSLNSFKIDLSKSIWQRNYFERIIRNEKELSIFSRYIRNNPANWENDRFRS